MDSFMKCANPKDIRYTLNITMTCAEWEKLREQLKTADHGWLPPLRDLVSHVNDIMGQINETYAPADTTPPSTT